MVCLHLFGYFMLSQFSIIYGTTKNVSSTILTRQNFIFSSNINVLGANILMYAFNQSFDHGQDVTQVNFWVDFTDLNLVFLLDRLQYQS